MKKLEQILHEKTKKKTSIGASNYSKHRSGRKNKQKKFACDYRGQGR